MKGKKPKPTKLKLVEGVTRKDRLNQNEPIPAGVTKIPRPPVHLSQNAQKAWKNLGPKLMVLGLLTEIDIQAFEGLCQSYGRWVEAELMVKKTSMVMKTPNDYLAQNTFLAIANRAWEQMMKAFAEFGLTPSSRSRISVGGPPGSGGIEGLID